MVWLVYAFSFLPPTFALLFYGKVEFLVEMYAKPRVLVMQVAKIDYTSLDIANLPASRSKEYMVLLDVGVLAYPAPVRALVEQRWLLSHVTYLTTTPT